MPRRLLSDGQGSFKGGLNTNIDPSVLRDDEVYGAENFRITDNGVALKRGGTQRCHTTALANDIQGGYGWMKAGGGYHIIVANGKVNTTPIGSIPRTLTELASAVDTTATVDMVAFRDSSGEVVYIADGGPINKTTAATLTINISGTPNVTSLAVYNQRLFGVDGVTQNLYASAINNGDTIGIPASSGIIAVVRTFGDQEIFAVRALRSSLAIFHRSGISRFTGLTIDDVEIESGTQGFSDTVGTISKKSLVSVEDAVYFFAEQGFYRLTDGGLERLSTGLDDLMSTLDSSKFGNVHGVHDKLRREVRWFVPEKGVYCYNYVGKAWSGPWTGIHTSDPVTAMWNTEAEGSTPSQCFFGSEGGWMRLSDANPATDDVTSAGSGGTRVSGSIALHRMFFGDESIEKALRWIYVHANLKGGNTAYARWRTTSNVGTGQYTFPIGTALTLWNHSQWNHGFWVGASQALTYALQGDGRGDYFDITLFDDGPAETIFSRVRCEAFDMSRR